MKWDIDGRILEWPPHWSSDQGWSGQPVLGQQREFVRQGEIFRPIGFLRRRAMRQWHAGSEELVALHFRRALSQLSPHLCKFIWNDSLHKPNIAKLTRFGTGFIWLPTHTCVQNLK